MTLEYFKQFLRRPVFLDGERTCCNELLCSMRNLSANAGLKLCSWMRVNLDKLRGERNNEQTETFFGVEFLLPDQLDVFLKTKKLPEKRGMCLLCIVQMVNLAYFEAQRYSSNERDWTPLREAHARGESQEYIDELMRQQDLEVIAKRMRGWQPFMVSIEAGQFSAEECLSIVSMRSGGSNIIMPFPHLDKLDFHWYKVNGVWIVCMNPASETMRAQVFRESP